MKKPTPKFNRGDKVHLRHGFAGAECTGCERWTLIVGGASWHGDSQDWYYNVWPLVSPESERKLEAIKPKCSFQAFGFMPPCVLDPGHTTDHEDGFGGHYGRTEGKELVQVEGTKELRYV